MVKITSQTVRHTRYGSIPTHRRIERKHMATRENNMPPSCPSFLPPTLLKPFFCRSSFPRSLSLISLQHASSFSCILNLKQNTAEPRVVGLLRFFIINDNNYLNLLQNNIRKYILMISK
jgi:hypothetical protein